MSDHGIDNLKRFFDYLFTATSTALTLDADQDGKVEIGEIFLVITGPLLYQFPKMYESIPQVKSEFKDLDDQELAELVSHITENDYLPARFDNLEEFIRKTVNWLHYNYQYVQFTKGHFSKNN